MESLGTRLDYYVNKSITAYLKARRTSHKNLLPVDLYDLADAMGNIDVEDREMILEAAVTVEGSRFRIYLQKNFKDQPGMAVRRRFSLAHEIAHTFFFEAQGEAVKPVPGGPRGLKLEAACHEGARRLLIPEQFLQEELKTNEGHLDGESILRWARTFDVSVEVILRRLQNHPALDSDDVSFALVTSGQIKFAMYPALLMPILPAPVRDTRFADWLSHKGVDPQIVADGSYRAVTQMGILTARRIEMTTSRDLFEMRIKAVVPNSQLGFLLGQRDRSEGEPVEAMQTRPTKQGADGEGC